MINSTAIRTAIAELLEGTIGSVRHMATSEYLSVDANAFSSWSKSGGVVITADQLYGPNGEKTADRAVAPESSYILRALTGVPDNAVVDYSVYIWCASGSGSASLNILKKDGAYVYGSSETINGDITKYTLSNTDILSGETTPIVILNFVSADTYYLAEAHVTSDDYLFPKIDEWDDAIVESTIEPTDGKILVNTRYDIRFPSVYQHGSSPVSAIGSHKLDELDIVIELTHKLDSNVQETARNTIRERVLYNGDRIMQALHFPNNLYQTSASVATGIVSGMMYGLSHDIDSENWEDKPPRIVSIIRGKAAIHNTQLTS